MSKKVDSQGRGDLRRGRRRFSREFKEEAVQMLLDGHTAASIAERLELSGPNLLSRWVARPGRLGAAGTR